MPELCLNSMSVGYKQNHHCYCLLLFITSCTRLLQTGRATTVHLSASAFWEGGGFHVCVHSKRFAASSALSSLTHLQKSVLWCKDHNQAELSILNYDNFFSFFFSPRVFLCSLFVFLFFLFFFFLFYMHFLFFLLF